MAAIETISFTFTPVQLEEYRKPGWINGSLTVHMGKRLRATLSLTCPRLDVDHLRNIEALMGYIPSFHDVCGWSIEVKGEPRPLWDGWGGTVRPLARPAGVEAEVVFHFSDIDFNLDLTLTPEEKRELIALLLANVNPSPEDYDARAEEKAVQEFIQAAKEERRYE